MPGPHAKVERLVTVTATSARISVGSDAGTAVTSYEAPYPALGGGTTTPCTTTLWLNVGTPLPLNQLTPSCAMSKRRVYAPPFGGACTWACTVTVCPCGRSAGSRVRRPSHTTSAPAWSYQWYPRSTGCPMSVGKVPCPVFAIVTGTVTVWPSPIVGTAPTA